MLNLANVSFTGVPNDTVKKIDVLGDVGDELQNSLVSKISAFDTNLDGIISSSLKSIKGIGDAFLNTGMDLPSARDRIKEALGGSRYAISEISEMLERGITGDMTGMDEGTGYVRGANTMIDSVKLVMDGVDRTFNQSGYKNVSGVMGFIRDLTGNQLIQTFDLGAEAALIRGVITEVSKWGVPELIDETFGAKWDSDNKRYNYDYSDEFRFSVTKRASDSISPSTNLAVIQTLITHGGDKALVAENPAFPTQLLNGYVIPDGCVQGGPFPVDPADPYGPQTVPNYRHQGYSLMKILDTLNPTWFKVERVYQTGDDTNPFARDTVWRLEFLQTASEGAKTVLSTDPEVRDALLAAPFYRIESGVNMLKSMYPYIVL